jgi:hypothetical protein
VNSSCLRSRSALLTDLNPPAGSCAINLPTGFNVVEQIPYSHAAPEIRVVNPICHELSHALRQQIRFLKDKLQFCIEFEFNFRHRPLRFGLFLQQGALGLQYIFPR